jgi:hypothetical protein
MNRFSQSTFNRPGFKTPQKRRMRNVSALCPLSNGFGASVVCNSFISSLVVSLFFACSPFTVLKTVISIVVNSFKSQIRAIRIRHILYKIFDIKPSFADFYTTTSVVFKGWAHGIATPVNHIYPYRIQGMVRFSMNQFSLGCIFTQRACTGMYMACKQIVHIIGFYISAIAITQSKFSWLIFDSFSPCTKQNKPTETRAGVKSGCFTNWSGYNNLIHGFFLTKRLMIEAVSGTIRSQLRLFIHTKRAICNNYFQNFGEL